jgi:PelA/Pel-15E family pectate lyase
MKYRIAVLFLIVMFGVRAPGLNPGRTAQAASTTIKWHDALRQKAEWYRSDEAVRVADNLLIYQRGIGGWPKNIDMAAVLTEPQRSDIASEKLADDSTIDNGATSTQLNYLARVYAARGLARHKESFLRGLDYLLKAQYDNGGWPQYYPRLTGYYKHITFNDDAMTGVLRLLQDIARKKTAFAFVDEARRARAESAVAGGIECILKTQVLVRGKRTVWCAQHDEITFAPAPARTYEPVSLSGLESVGIVRFLMDVDRPDARVVEAIKSAVAWFRTAQLNGIRWLETAAKATSDYDHVVVADRNAPPLWARFYEIETNRPIFSGRDGVIKYKVSEIEAERRNGYRWYTEAPGKLLNQDYPAWLKRIGPVKTATK